jgi:hypothetical protein
MNDIDCFLYAAAASNNIFDDDEFFLRRNLKTAAQDKFAIFFFDKDMTFAQGTSDFLANNNSAESRGDDCVAIKVAQLVGEFSAHLRSDVGVLQENCALEILTAMQTGAQDEMAIQQSAGLTEKREEIFAHLGSARASRAGDGALAIANFSWLGVSFGLSIIEAFRRGHRNGHARARALPGSGIISAGSVIRRLSTFIRDRNDLDFHIRVFRQCGDLDSGTRRRILLEIRAINLVHDLEII